MRNYAHTGNISKKLNSEVLESFVIFFGSQEILVNSMEDLVIEHNVVLKAIQSVFNAIFILIRVSPTGFPRFYLVTPLLIVRADLNDAMFCLCKKRDQLHSLDFNKTMIDVAGKLVET